MNALRLCPVGGVSTVVRVGLSVGRGTVQGGVGEGELALGASQGHVTVLVQGGRERDMY